MNRPRIVIEKDPDAVAAAAARNWLRLAREAVSEQGVFHVALSGGSTPRRLHAALAAAAPPPPWAAVEAWFGDKRCVPPDDPESNYRMARETLFDRVPIAPGHIHPILCSPADCRRAAHAYARTLATRLPAAASGMPRLDLAVLGMGPDGHTASLFPGSCILSETERPAAAVYVDRLKAWRVSLTRPLLEAARHLMFIVTGADKAPAVARALATAHDPAGLPVQRLAPAGEVTWYLDAAAAAGLEETRP